MTKPYRRVIPRIGRNAKCPCGSGAKFKDCHDVKPLRKCADCVCQAPRGQSRCCVCRKEVSVAH